MQSLARLLVFVCALSLFGCERAGSTSLSETSSKPIQVVSAEFGLFKVGADGKADFVPTKTVPLTVSQPYGWVVKLRTSHPKVKWREEFTLPSAPEHWGSQPGVAHTVSDDRTVSVVHREVDATNGVIFNAWEVAAGDPKGRYVIRLTIEDSTPIVFEFNVE